MGLGSTEGTGRPASGPVAGRSWMVRGKDGRLSAYGVADGALLRWTETRPGGPDWKGPEVFPALELTGLTIAQGTDGFVHVVGRRQRKDTEAEYLHATQYQSGRPLGAWSSLGTRTYPDPARVARMGAPTVAVDGSGAVHVFVRNGYGGVLLRRQAANGKWEEWKDLRGVGCGQPLTATTTDAGLIELLATTNQGHTTRWTQPDRGAPFSPPAPLPFDASEGTVTGLETTENELTYYGQVPLTEPTDDAPPTDGTPPSDGTLPTDGPPAPAPTTIATLCAHRTGPDPDPDPDPDHPLTPLRGTEPTPHTPLAALRAPIDGHDCTILAHRTTTGRPALAACRTLAEPEGLWWSLTGPECLGPPALALDATNRVVMAVIATDGTLHVARQRTDEKGLSLAAWVRV
ncbi:hypothetical protein GCM10010329_26620 [Streptomyces spiroverticillatus]|uniref:Uncharacterized protein n=1 Tax=Streptomyces finlayi TaxID=67296 RepID=A0A918WV89_9ACTN|nr:hypothetical protein [Streptomyces finlayi]GHA03093.1 hypothetical protein GCM10010329_26620 [Streptomyces spiroverticillatus]GHC87276.1 hypothetical protein GCM10010334_19030 [Streptomyces finlayi]